MVLYEVYGDTGTTVITVGTVMFFVAALLALLWGIAQLTPGAVFAGVVAGTGGADRRADPVQSDPRLRGCVGPLRHVRGRPGGQFADPVGQPDHLVAANPDAGRAAGDRPAAAPAALKPVIIAAALIAIAAAVAVVNSRPG